jgi:hypothetical protein
MRGARLKIKDKVSAMGGRAAVDVMMGILVALLLFAGTAVAQEEPDKDHAAIFELGAAGERGLKDGTSSFGPAVAAEVTPIEDWLELELGVTPLFGGGRTEWDTDLLFKKPFRLSETAEFMAGAGPEWVHTNGHGNSISAEAALDFMFWPWPGRKYGWYLEPSYGYNFARGHDQSLGVTVGLLIAFP